MINKCADIDQKHKIWVKRPRTQVFMIVCALLMILFAIFIIVTGMGRMVINGLIKEFAPKLDQANCPVITELPLVFTRDKSFGRKKISLCWGLINFEMGDPRQRYYFVFDFKNRKGVKAEVTQETYSEIGFFTGISVDYVIGKYSKEYYVKKVYPGNEKVNGGIQRLKNLFMGK